VPGKMSGRKRSLTALSENRSGEHHELTGQHELLVTQGHHGIDAHGAPHGDIERRQGREH
jgi:hypothetical protein